MNFTKEELVSLNELMLGRGRPSTNDGIGYNKADYGVCAMYYKALSDAQYADLAKRLVKYCNTQLNICKEAMKKTASELEKTANSSNRSDGISLDVREDGILFSFRFNQSYIDVLKRQSERRYDNVSKCWIIPKSGAVKALKELQEVGADVDNALNYIYKEGLQEVDESLAEVVIVENNDFSIVKFDYKKEIVEAIKQIDKSERGWNAKDKYWTVNNRKRIKELEINLLGVAKFKYL